VLTFVSSSGLSRMPGSARPADGRSAQPARFGPSHPAAIPRTPPFTAVCRRVDNSMTCRDSSPESAEIRTRHVRNVEVGGSSPLTSTRKLQVRPYFLADLLSMEMSSSRGHPAEGRSAVVPGSSPEVQTMRPSRSRSAISTWAVTASITGDGVSVQVMR
jgi:hypothetical protein